MLPASTTTATDTDILIAGAGPVGLFLANECARRGLRCRVVEAHASQSTHSKALAIFPRTLEIFDMAGLVGPFLDVANRVTSVAVIAHDRVLARVRFMPEESPYPFIAMVPQDVTERLLVEALQRRGGAVEYETSFVSAVEENAHVRVTLDRKGQRTDLTAAFVVGCDGAHSAVRHLLALPFEGGEYEAAFLLADIETNDALPADELQLCPSELGPIAIFPMSATRRRIVATMARADGEAPSLALVRELLARRAPAGIEARSVSWSSYFRVHHRLIAELRVGRLFIAGDAAHIHSPFGGQGMNTGLHDIWNLAWKLDLALRGLGTDALLDSYSAERLPAIKHVIETTDRLTKAMGTSSWLAQTVRDVVIPMVSRLSAFQHAFVERLSGLGLNYRGSPIIDGAGARYFDDSLRGGDGIGSRFLLLCGEQEELATHAEARQLAASLGDRVELRTIPGLGITLVRPDGYVAYSAHGRDVVGALRSVRCLVARQTVGGGVAVGDDEARTHGERAMAAR